MTENDLTPKQIPMAHADFKPHQFPLHITWYRGEDVAHHVEVAGPEAVWVPALGGITRCVIALADGTVYDTAEP